jgi:hypothetical protein
MTFLPKPERNGIWVLRIGTRPTSRVGFVSKFVREAGTTPQLVEITDQLDRATLGRADGSQSAVHRDGAGGRR